MRESRTLVAARMSVTGWLFGVAQALLMGLLAVFVLASGAAAQQNQINTVVGGGPNDMPALDADLYGIWQTAVDSAGNLYFASSYDDRVFKVTVSTGELTVVAGNGVAGYSGDGVTGGAAKAMLNSPQGVAVDSNGNVYISDTDNCIVREVNQTTSTITTVAGTPDSCGYAGDGGPGTSAQLSYPNQLAVDSSNNVFIADYANSVIRKLTVSTGDISTVAGEYGGSDSGVCANGTAATSCAFATTPAVAVDGSDDFFLTDGEEYVVYKVSGSTGKITKIAGTWGTAGYTGDGSSAINAEIYPYVYGQLAVNSGGTKVWLADTYNFVIRQVIVGGDISSIAGENSCGGGFSGMGGSATSACISYPGGVAVDSAGDLFTAPTYVAGYSLYALEAPCLEASGSCTPPTGDTTGDIYIVAGNGNTSVATPINGVPALGVTLYYPGGVLVDPSNNVFISDTGDCYVRELVNASGDVNLFAGNGTCGYGGDGGAATSASVYQPAGVARDANGNIFFADQYNQIIREVDAAGNISTFAGTPQVCSYSGDGVPATSAMLCYPHDVSLDIYGNMFIADSNNLLIREVVCATSGTLTCTPPIGETAGYIYTVAGNGTAGYSGDGGPATSAQLYYPESASADSSGNLYIADTDNCRIRKVNATTGTISTIAGNGDCGFSGDGIAIDNSVSYPYGLRVDANGNVFFTDTDNSRVRWVDGGGTMTTFAGTSSGFSGDGGPATAAELYFPEALSEDASGDFFIADSYNYRIREINAFAAVGRSTGSVSFPLQSVGTTSDGVDITLSGIGAASISNITTSANFSEFDDCGNLPNGSTCTVTVYFTPTKAGTITGTLTVTSNGYLSTTTTVALEGEAVGLTITPNPLAFGSDPVGTTVTKSVTIKGSTTYTSTTLDKDTTDFAISANTCTGTVTTSCSITVKFDPTTTGAKKGTLVVVDSDPTSPQLIGLTGTATSYESFTPASVTFANQVINTASKATKITFKYTGSGTLSLGSLTPTAPFTVNETGITSEACNPGTTKLTTNELCYFNVVFTPTATGTATGSVTAAFTGDPTGNTSSVLPLTGTGTAVSLSPASLAFGTVTSGTKKLSLTITNKGSSALTLNGTPTISGTGSAQFAVLAYSASPATSTCLNPALGSSLTAGSSCTYTVQFTSTGEGVSYTDYLSISDSDPTSPQKVTMTAKD